jgi:hypothetical protein
MKVHQGPSNDRTASRRTPLKWYWWALIALGAGGGWLAVEVKA